MTKDSIPRITNIDKSEDNTNASNIKNKLMSELTKIQQKQLKNLNKIMGQALALDDKEAIDDNSLGFMAQLFVLASLPHRKPAEQEFTRKNGDYTLTLLAKKDVGLPYGSYPRLLLAWLTAEAVKTQSREIYLGDNITQFMRELDITVTWGRGGSVGKFNAQMKRLFSCFISCSFDDRINKIHGVENIKIASKFMNWWNMKDQYQSSLFKSVLTLDKDFYESIIANPVPIDMRALKILKKSPMALDVYTWLTYRMSYLNHNVSIPFESLQLQFGADIARKDHFKAKFLEALFKVVIVYPELNIDYNIKNLILKPSPTHIKKLKE